MAWIAVGFRSLNPVSRLDGISSCVNLIHTPFSKHGEQLTTVLIVTALNIFEDCSPVFPLFSFL